MSEYLAAHLTIGGPILRRHVAQLCAAIGRENVSLNWGEAIFRPQSAADLLDARIEMGAARVLRLCDEQARWGQFDALEQLLIRCQISFERQSDGKYDISPERFSYRPETGGVVYLTNAQERIVIEAEPLWKLLDALAEAHGALRRRNVQLAQRKVSLVRRALSRLLPRRPLPLPSLEIVPSRPRARRQPRRRR